jgi:hypothetical protein
VEVEVREGEVRLRGAPGPGVRVRVERGEVLRE